MFSNDSMVIFYHQGRNKTEEDQEKNWTTRPGEMCLSLLTVQIDPKHPQTIDCWLSIHTLFNTNARYKDNQLLVADWCVCISCVYISNLGGFHGMVIKTNQNRKKFDHPHMTRATTLRNFVDNWFRPTILKQYSNSSLFRPCDKRNDQY
jgi:hypothetical protein